MKAKQLKLQNFYKNQVKYKIKSDFYNYVISIPVKAKNIPPEVLGFRYVNMESLNDYYDEKTGFKTKGEALIW